MKELSLFKLLQKLSGLGLETLELLSSRGSRGFEATISELCTTLLKLKGEAASIAIAEEILEEYAAANDEEKLQFFTFLHDKLSVDTTEVTNAIAACTKDSSQAAIHALALACEPARLELFRTLNYAPGGTMALIRMREDLRKLLKHSPHLLILDTELQDLFKAWFNRGFLELQNIDWETPAMVLEKLIQYESVHEIKGWPDLRHRLEIDRGCFGFFHPAIPNVPLIFVEAALTNKISTNISELLHQPPPDHLAEAPTTAVFYSINNCLQGLRGVSFGNFLIKQVIEKLVVDAPSITRYATLSPVPGFMRWLTSDNSQPVITGTLDDKAAEAVKQWLTNEQTEAALSSSDLLKEALLKLCGHYLVKEKSRTKPADAVARFHLGNGAILEQINWLADTSSNGLSQSAGIMVNYVYERKNLARNHEAYEQRNEVVYSSTIRKILA